MGRTRTTNSGMFSNTSGEGKIRRHPIEADVVDCRVYHTRKELRPGDIQGIAGTYYADAAIVKLGKRLAAVLEEPDTGFEGDVRESNQWAAILGIGEWFDWQAFEDVPTSYLSSS